MNPLAVLKSTFILSPFSVSFHNCTHTHFSKNESICATVNSVLVLSKFPFLSMYLKSESKIVGLVVM